MSGKEQFTLPKAPKELCFNENDFDEDDFNVDVFLQEHKKSATLETMRDDLGVYLKILRSAMIELINKDYADFVNLSSNLIDLDKAINNLQTPLGQLREEVMQVRQTLDDVIAELMEGLNERRRLRERKQSLQSLARVYKSIAKLSQILTATETLKPDILERAATEFNQLKFHTSRCQSDIAPVQLKRIGELEARLTANLNELFVKSVREKQSDLLTRCLRIYITLDKVADAEQLVRRDVVGPAIEDLISESKLQSEPLGLRGVYQQLADVLNDDLSQLLAITLYPERVSVKGFNFLVNSFWLEVVERIATHLSSIFAPGNPELFYKRYLETLDFLGKLAEKCGTPETLSLLKNHEEYKGFLKKWNLPVYFQIRFQEIAGAVEAVLREPVSPASIKELANVAESQDFSLHATCVVWDSLLKTCADGVFLLQLLHRFWKLGLQICSRYNTWCQSASKQDWPRSQFNETSSTIEVQATSRLQFLVCLYTDLNKFVKRWLAFLNVVRARIPDAKPSLVRLLEDCSADTARRLEDTLPAITQEIIGELMSQSAVHLKQVSDIPRLFRRTNREVPTKPCVYVNNAICPLAAFHAEYKTVIPTTVAHWLELALSSLTEQYLASVTDVLTSVQKTEESLRRLKKIRDKSTRASQGEGKGMSDDDKIRVQLEIDVRGYDSLIRSLEVSASNVSHLQDLIKVAEDAVKSNRNESK